MKKMFLVCMLSFFAVIVFSQRSIVLKNPEKKDTWIINVDDIVGYELKSDPTGMYTGEVQNIKDSSVVISGEEIKLSAIRMIKIKRKHGRTSVALGIFLIAIGAAAAPVNNSQDGGLVSKDFVTIAQVVFIGSGGYFLVKGIVELSAPHKCYLDEGWSVRTVLTSTINEE